MSIFDWIIIALLIAWVISTSFTMWNVLQWMKEAQNAFEEQHMILAQLAEINEFIDQRLDSLEARATTIERNSGTTYQKVEEGQVH